MALTAGGGSFTVGGVDNDQTIIKMDGQGRIVLPKAGRNKKVKYFAYHSENDGSIHLTPVVGVITPKQAYFWSKRWQMGEKQASQDLQQGHFKTVEPGELGHYLKSFK